MSINITYQKLIFNSKIRQIEHFGISRYAQFVIFFLLFYMVSKRISEVSFGNYILLSLYMLISISFNSNRKDLNYIFFFHENIWKVKFTSNLIISLPFIISSVFLSYYWIILIIVFFSFMLSLFDINYSTSIMSKVNLSWLMPNFEFIEGFRKYFLVHLTGLFFIYVGWQVDNFNISIFGLAIYVITFSLYYSTIEDKKWIWVNLNSAEKFINVKIFQVLRWLSIFSIPLVIFFIFHENGLIILIYVLSFYLSTLNIMMSKYSDYGSKESIQLRQGISMGVLAIAIISPFFIVINIILFFYLKNKAIKTLHHLLC